MLVEIRNNFMRLPKGVTGFYDKGEAPLTVDTKAFAAVCHDAMRSVGGQVLKIKVDSFELHRNYFRVDVQVANGTLRQIVCNKYYPLIAIALEAEDGEAYPRFVDEPNLATTLSAWGAFEVLSVETLGTVPDMINTALLGKAELEQVRYWKPELIGQILFNHWD
jgi:hypothetical protein